MGKNVQKSQIQRVSNGLDQPDDKMNQMVLLEKVTKKLSEVVFEPMPTRVDCDLNAAP